MRTMEYKLNRTAPAAAFVISASDDATMRCVQPLIYWSHDRPKFNYSTLWHLTDENVTGMLGTITKGYTVGCTGQGKPLADIQAHTVTGRSTLKEIKIMF